MKPTATAFLGTARASRAVVGTLAEHTFLSGEGMVGSHGFKDVPTGEAPVGTREGACAPLQV